MAADDWQQGGVDARAVLDELDAGVVLVDASGAVRAENQRAVELLRAAAPPAGRHLAREADWDLVAPDGAAIDARERPVARALATAEPVRGVVLGVRGRAGRIWVQASAIPRLGADGRVDSVILTLADVSAEQTALAELLELRQSLEAAVRDRTTELLSLLDRAARSDAERTQAERARDDSDTLHRSVVRAMGEGVVVHAVSGAIETANPAAERVLGLSLDQLQGRTAVDPRWRLLRQDGTPLASEEIPSEITARTGRPCTGVLLGVERGTGILAWLSVSTEPLGPPPAPGERCAVVATFTDITTERLAVQALERSRAAFQRLTEAVPGLLYQLDVGADGGLRFRFVGEQARELLGVPALEMLADADAAFVNVVAEDRETALRALAESAETLGPWECELRVQAGDGSIRHARNRAVAERDGERTVLSGVILDVTEERRLVGLVHASQRREAIGAVTAGIAHNFNNALAVLVPNLEELLASAVPGEPEEMLRDSLRAARSAVDLVKQLMRIVRASPRTERDAVDLVGLVGDATALAAKLMRGRVRLLTGAGVPAAAVLAGRGELQQVILNLVLNARDALADREDGTIFVGVNRVKEDGAEWVELVVRDDGVGMPEAVRLRLGEPFFTTKAPGAGTGLGLATTYATVRDLRGQITCRTGPGQGTEFRILLPDATTDYVAPAPSLPPARLTVTRRVLVVDDDVIVQRALARQLRRRGFAVESAMNGVDGLAVFDTRPDEIDAIVLDLAMPGMSGERVLEELRARDAEIPIVIVSGFVEHAGSLADASAVLEKPVDADTLAELLERLLGGGPDAPEIPAV